MTGAMKADVRTFEEIEADPTAMDQAVTVIVLAGLASLDRKHLANGRHRRHHGARRQSVRLRAVGTPRRPDWNEADARANDQGGLQRRLPRDRLHRGSRHLQRASAIIPFLGPLISFVIWIWMVVIGVVAVRQVLDYSEYRPGDHRLPDRRGDLLDCDDGDLVPLLIGSAVMRGLSG